MLAPDLGLLDPSLGGGIAPADGRSSELTGTTRVSSGQGLLVSARAAKLCGDGQDHDHSDNEWRLVGDAPETFAAGPPALSGDPKPNDGYLQWQMWQRRASYSRIITWWGVSLLLAPSFAQLSSGAVLALSCI